MDTGQNLKAARLAAGMSLDDAAYALRDRLPKSMWMGRASIGRIEQGKQPAACWLIVALAQAYGVTIASISAEAAEEWKELRDLVNASSGCNNTDLVNDGAGT